MQSDNTHMLVQMHSANSVSKNYREWRAQAPKLR